MNKIILYSTHCPRCNVLEKKLKEKNISYTEINDPDALLLFGINTVPCLEVDGARLNFKEAVEWVRGVVE